MKKITILFLLLFLFQGCSSLVIDPHEGKAVKNLAEEGIRLYNNAENMKNNGKFFYNSEYKKAIEIFDKLKSWYPFSKFSILAEFKIPEAYFYMEEYSAAIFAYKHFERLHPLNQSIPYVVYQTGLSYYNQIDTVGRDQLNTKNALEAFKKLIKKYPEYKNNKDAEEKILICKKNLARKEMYIGLFYFNSDHYKSALGRFETVISKYPEAVDYNKEASKYIALCKKKIKEIKNNDTIINKKLY